MNEAIKSVPRAPKEIKLTPADELRFWAKINKDGPTMPHMDTPCWVWTANKHEDGYGRINVRKKVLTSHRIAWTLHFGEIPPGLCVMHRCDNPSCCRVSHFQLGTHVENIHDRDAKKRNGCYTKPEKMPRGNSHGMAKITADMVISIRSAAGGLSQREIAARFGISQCNVSNIINRKLWSHIP
jgi:HNH endonuclease